jgi:hypothetical protein
MLVVLEGGKTFSILELEVNIVDADELNGLFGREAGSLVSQEFGINKRIRNNQ